jgi:Fe2+ transport system protein FeoA
VNEPLKLDQIRAGGVVKLLGFARCRRRGLRLTELGLTPGTRVEVLRASPGQPLLLRVRGAQLAVDRKTAHKICVELISGERTGLPQGGHRRHKRGEHPGRLGRSWRRRSHRRRSSQDHDEPDHEDGPLNG